MKRLSALVICSALVAVPVSARTEAGLAAEADINQGLLAVAVADKIRRSCGSIGGRLFKAQKYVKDLRSLAAARGYTEAEIDAYISSKAEKARMREQRNAYFSSRGASNLDAQSLCVLGYDEIARGTQIGQFLKAK